MPRLAIDRQHHPRMPRAGAPRLHQSLRRVPVDHRRHPQQDDERRIPRRVEQVAGDQQVDLLRRPAATAASAAPSTHAKNTTNVSELKTMVGHRSFLRGSVRLPRPPWRRFAHIMSPHGAARNREPQAPARAGARDTCSRCPLAGRTGGADPGAPKRCRLLFATLPRITQAWLVS